MSGSAFNNDIDIVGGTQPVQSTVGDEERHHLTADEDDFVEQPAERDGSTPYLLSIGMIEVDDHVAAPSRCRR
ncbi:hypothetical protein MASR1M101_35320 [Gemmatimonas sp.]